ncbi:hypothetical protein BHE90_009175 [Fusarium euwallaceae]|uniref:MARVEL domain-containing protein n=5 Tax=Fusarium solani species complex TaxID=232080 RepID=A0A3M2S9A0_9HYPO|nr:hypothetical protein CDV36_006207 [Fusarium kuroshium]RSL66233.1 hypothetical protein CEP51_012850 [Fusarium floridanum]RSL87894.1 hypothetical protein CDV31_016174 [Fusarium ambrosium]RSL98728.1 hypothetical protein CEP52_010179 [Fusarium oligoseptatum]RTE76357.1 hypothetical protein BHE90_009175 [Fusarium euwallaceae]
MGRVVLISLRVLQLALSLASISLSSYVINWFMKTKTAIPSPFNYLLVSSILSVFSLVYLELVPRFAPRFSQQYVAIGVESVNAALYFAGFIAIAIYIGSLIFCEGAVCSSGRADAVVAAGQFTTWIATTILMAKDMFKRGFEQPKYADNSREMGQV